MKNNAGFVKGSAITSLVFSAGIGIGLYFLKQYHTDKVDQARIEGIEYFISSGNAAKYANGEMPEGEFPLCEMSSKQDWEVIVRYHPDKKSNGRAKTHETISKESNLHDSLERDFAHLKDEFKRVSALCRAQDAYLKEYLAGISPNEEIPADPKK